MNAKDKLGDTPLHKTIVNGYKACAQVLIEHGASINLPNIGLKKNYLNFF